MATISVVKTNKGGTEMIGAEQFIVALWFLPVVLFIVLPLGIGCVWGLISVLTSPFRQTTTLEETLPAPEPTA